MNDLRLITGGFFVQRSFLNKRITIRLNDFSVVFPLQNLVSLRYNQNQPYLMIFTLCYISKATEGLNETAIEDIFLTTMQRNTTKKIHGILLHGMGDFFQVLEGDKKQIESLFENEIKLDTRHSEIFEVIRKYTKKPIFSAYSSLFTIVKTTEQLKQIKDYLKLNKVDTTSNKLSRLLNPFLLDI